MSRWWSATVVVGILCSGLLGVAVGPAAVAAQGPVPVSVTDLNGTGTASDPYVVTNASELQAMNQSLGANYTLGGNINASETAGWFGGSGFVPLGDTTTPFTGTFDGNGYVIEGLSINRSMTDDVGLVGRLGASGTVTTVGLEAADVGGATRVGGLVGVNDGTVGTSYATGRIGGSSEMGGLVGQNRGTVRKSYATGAVVGTTDSGGLVGNNSADGSVTSSYAAANVSGSSGVGGLVGTSSAIVTDAYWDLNTTEQSVGIGTGLETQQMQGGWSTENMSAFDFGSTWSAVPGDYPDLQAMPRQTSTPNREAPTPTELARIVSELEYYNGAYNITSDKALQTLSPQLNGNQFEEPYYPTPDNEFGDSYNPTPGANYRLEVDIDASGTATWNGGAGFAPIGNSDFQFNGALNGEAHTITGLTVDTFGYAGLFGHVGSSNTITNLHMEAVDISGGSQYTGGLIAHNSGGTVTDSRVTGSVAGDEDVGGLVGRNSGGTIRHSSAASSVTGTTRVGGLVGDNAGILSRTAASGTVSGDENVGGLVGFSNGMINSSSATGPVTAIEPPELTNSIGFGGLVGRNDGAVAQSYANGGFSVSTPLVMTGQAGVGGLVGFNTGTVGRGYATGNLTTPGFEVDTGGLVGFNQSGTGGSIADAYWDNGTTNQNTAVGNGSGTGLVGFGATVDETPATEMTGLLVASNMTALDFEAVWVPTDGYPSLFWQLDGFEPAEFRITELTAPASTAGSDTITVDYTVTNVGDGTATQDIALIVDDIPVQTVAGVELERGATRSGTFSYETTTDTGPTIVVAVTSFDDAATRSIGIESDESEEEEDSNENDTNDTNDTNDNSGGGSSSSGSSSRSDDDDVDQGTATVAAIDSTEHETVSRDRRDDTVRVSSASASARGGSTLEITLPPIDDGDEPANGEEQSADEPADDETDRPTGDSATDPNNSDRVAGDGGEAAADDPNRPPPPPVSQAEIERVEIDVNEDVDAEVEIRQSRGPPSGDASEFQRDDGTQVAGYIEVTDNLDDEQVTEGRITFRVSKADLETDVADPKNVALYHYVPETDEWEELDTEILGETDDYVRFRGTTPGFSQFAAGIKRAQFEISDTLVDVQQITLNDSIQVEAIVTNTGGADGTFTTQLLVDSEIVAEDVLTIASGGQRATIFDHEFEQADTYQVRVNDVLTGEIRVTDPNAAAESTADFLPGFSAGVAVVSLFVTILLFARRSDI